MSGLFSSASSSNNPTQGDLSKDIALTNPPEDGISALSFSTVQSDTNILAVSSWDSKTRIYQILQNGTSQPMALIQHDQPALACAWSKDGQKCISAGADGTARMLNLQQAGQAGAAAQIVAKHDSPIRCVKMFTNEGNDMVVTGSWDKTVKYWDLRSANPVATVQCQDRVYTMDLRDQLLVVGTADRYLNIINLAKPTELYKTMQSPLKFQTRVVSCFTDASGFAVGSIEGRCAIQYVEEKDAPNNFSFKCHRINEPTQRDQTKVFAVNAISFHPQHGTFSTAGADGTFHFWDKDAKHRLKGYPEVGGTISATDFSRTGDIFAYAVSYDWSKGYSGNTPNYPNKVMLHPIQGDECKPRPGGKKR